VSDQSELARREQRAQQGIVQFAEEMQAIRDERLYPGAGTNVGDEPWKTYCKTRWSKTASAVNSEILAATVIRRFDKDSLSNAPSVEKAKTVATLPIAVQDAILTDDPKAIAEDDVKAKAKAARKVKKQAEAEGREATDGELIAAAANVKSTRPKPKHRKSSKFTSRMEKAYYEIQQAADIAQGDTLTDAENDYGWNRVAKMRYELDRIEERLQRPEIVRDPDEEFAELLAGEER
jgi:hypothetical protein